MAETKAQEVSGLALLRKPFPPHQISKLPKPHKKDAPKGKCAECGGYHGLPAVHLDYVGHAALTDRLLDADPGWSWEPLALTAEGLPLFDKAGGLWIRLTVCGVTRLGYGNAEDKSYMDAGAREKEVIGDALRNAGMRFGAALELWHKGDLHVEEANGDKVDTTTGEVVEQAKPVEPEGFSEWWPSFVALAVKGWPTLKSEWVEVGEVYRAHALATRRDEVAALRRQAEAVSASSAAAVQS